MKKIIIYCLILVCFLIPFNFGVASSEESNILTITNGDFNEYTKKTSFGKTMYLPANWTTGTGSDGALVRWTNETACTGESCIYLLNTGSGVELTGEGISVEGGRRYRLGYKIKDAGLSQVSAQMKILAYDEEANKICEYVGETFYSSSEWVDVYVEFTLSVFAVSIMPVISVPFTGLNVNDKACFIDSVYGYETESVCDIFSVTNGASLRLVKNSPGIRFEAKIDKKAYDGYVSTYEDVSAGILIVPTESLESLTDFTVEELEDNNILYVTIPATKWYNTQTAEADGEYKFYCALINILEKNIARAFSVRAYISYQENGERYYDYSLYNESNNSRSIKQTAIRIKEDSTEEYNKTQTDIINYYATFGDE